jgi:CNT family concentrative nucleoside transporter
MLIAKVMLPETETPRTGTDTAVERETVNVVDAAAQGAISGLRLAAYVGAMLIAFVSLISLGNDILGGIGTWLGVADLSIQRVLGWAMAPFAWLLGVPGEDIFKVGGLLGIKTVLNEFLAYQQLGELARAGALQPRSILIASYALCGFANFGSLAILLGGIGGLAPSRRPDVAQLGLRSILGGTLTSFMTACLAGLLL